MRGWREETGGIGRRGKWGQDRIERGERGGRRVESREKRE